MKYVSLFVVSALILAGNLPADEKQRLTEEKNRAVALFVEGKTSQARDVLDSIRKPERELVTEEMKAAGVSSEPTALCRHVERPLPRRDTQQINDELRKLLSDVDRNVKTFHVAPEGTADAFSSLRQARDAARQWRKSPEFREGTVLVLVHGGVYTVTETLELDVEDSGIVYMARHGETPVFTGGVSVSNFVPVTDPAVLARLPDESRDKVLMASVPEDVEFPPVAPRGYGKNGLSAAPMVELFINDKPQQIARWPNAPVPKDGQNGEESLAASQAAFVRTGKVHRGFFDTETEKEPGAFEYSDPRHERWTEARDAMLFGYWGHLWAITSCRIEKIDTKTKQLVLATNNPYGYRENMPYYAFNLLEEIDVPGEWYLDRENRVLYVYPPENSNLDEAKVRLSCFPKNFLRLKNVSHAAFVGLEFEEGTGTAARVDGGENVQFIGCGFRRFGNWGLGIDGVNNIVRSCDFVTLGGGGIDMKGGDIKTLKPGGGLIRNCYANDFSRADRAYAPAVHLDGVGHRVSQNLFCDSPAHAMRLEGMEHTVERNEIHSVVYESDDQSGIDLWGNPFMRGMVLRWNYWHHIGSGRNVAGQSGIRLDDMISSVSIYGNVFFRASGGQFGGVQIHGGKDNVVDGNLFIDCRYAVSFSPWGDRRWLENLDKNFGARAREKGFDPDSEIYREKYPNLADLKKNADRNFITRNAAIGCDTFARNSRRNVMLENVKLPWMPDLFEETRGITETTDIHRVPAEARKIRRRLTVPEDSPLYGLLGIDPIPMRQIGLFEDNFRKEIPAPSVTPLFILE